MTASETPIRAEFGSPSASRHLPGSACSATSLRPAAPRPTPWRVYLVEAVFGGLIGAAVGFYLDTAADFAGGGEVSPLPRRGRPRAAFGVYAFLSKWGFINLGNVGGGREPAVRRGPGGSHQLVRAAWLFAINRTFLTAYFRRETAPIKSLFTRRGLVDVESEHARSSALGAVDVADHQLLPPAHGRADVVQPGRRHSHRGGHLPPRH